MCVAFLGLSVALGGTTWAAVSLPAGSVGTAQLKQDAVTGTKVKNHTLTGADIDKPLLGAVPSAKEASHALSADSATHAKTADSAGVAYSTHFEAGKPVPTQLTTIASLQVPAGSYVLSAKAQLDTFNNSDITDCELVAGSDKDVSFVQNGAGHQSEIITNSLVHAFATAGSVAFNCQVFGFANISQVRVTAVTVGSIGGAPTP